MSNQDLICTDFELKTGVSLNHYTFEDSYGLHTAFYTDSGFYYELESYVVNKCDDLDVIVSQLIEVYKE